MTQSIACPNCGEQVDRRFCPECGQERKPSVAPLSELLPDLLEEFLKFDSRLLSSIWLLLARPGLLTTEFLAGKRVRYLTPLKLYFTTSFVFFLVFFFTESDRVFSEALVDASDAIRLREWLSAHGPWLIALSAPFGAMALKVLHRKRLYAEHLVFCAHSQAQLLLAMLGCLFIPNETASDIAIVAIECVWTAFALRHVYGTRWAPLLLLHLPLLGAWYLLFFSIAFAVLTKLAGVRLQ